MKQARPLLVRLIFVWGNAANRCPHACLADLAAIPLRLLPSDESVVQKAIAADSQLRPPANARRRMRCHRRDQIPQSCCDTSSSAVDLRFTSALALPPAASSALPPFLEIPCLRTPDARWTSFVEPPKQIIHARRRTLSGLSLQSTMNHYSPATQQQLRECTSSKSYRRGTCTSAKLLSRNTMSCDSNNKLRPDLDCLPRHLLFLHILPNPPLLAYY